MLHSPLSHNPHTRGLGSLSSTSAPAHVSPIVAHLAHLSCCCPCVVAWLGHWGFRWRAFRPRGWGGSSRSWSKGGCCICWIPNTLHFESIAQVWAVNVHRKVWGVEWEVRGGACRIDVTWNWTVMPWMLHYWVWVPSDSPKKTNNRVMGEVVIRQIRLW